MVMVKKINHVESFKNNKLTKAKFFRLNISELVEKRNSWCINRLNNNQQDTMINLPYCFVLSNSAIQNVLKVFF